MISKTRLAPVFALWITAQQCSADTTTVFIAADFVRATLERLLPLR